MKSLSSLRIGIAQLCSRAEPKDNLEQIRLCLETLSKQQADLSVFPEYCFCLGSFERMLRHAASPGHWQELLGKLCCSYQSAAVFGGVTIIENGHYYDSSLAFSASGELLARYDKRHLFSWNDKTEKRLQEGEVFTPGNTSPTLFRLHGWKIALTICFDLRFPSFWQSATPHPDLFLCTAAFTHKTGQAHWQTLLQARAIENLSFVTGIGQGGSNPETGLELHGHSILFDPWGEITGSLPHRQPDNLCLSLDKQLLKDCRERLPGCAFTSAAKTQDLDLLCRR